MDFNSGPSDVQLTLDALSLRAIFCGVNAIIVLSYGCQFVSHSTMMLSCDNHRHILCDNSYLIQTVTKHNALVITEVTK